MPTEEVFGNQLLFAGLESILDPTKFAEATKRVKRAAYDAIFQAQEAGKLKWSRSGQDFEDMVAQVTVKNGRDENITIQAILTKSFSEDGGWSLYLYLGGKNQHSPCRNSWDEHVTRLYASITGKGWNPNEG